MGKPLQWPESPSGFDFWPRNPHSKIADFCTLPQMVVFELEGLVDINKSKNAEHIWTGNSAPVTFLHWSFAARRPERTQILGRPLEKWAFSPRKRDFWLWRCQIQKNSRFQTLTRVTLPLRSLFVMGASASNDRKVSERSFRSFLNLCQSRNDPCPPRASRANGTQGFRPQLD